MAVRRSDNSSECSTEVVPTSTGVPRSYACSTISVIASHFAFTSLNTAVGSSTRTRRLCGGTVTTSRRYVRHSSSSSVRAVPVMPASFGYSLKNDWYVMVAAETCSPDTSSPSFASTAWWMLSVHLRDANTRPVNSSTICTLSSRIM